MTDRTTFPPHIADQLVALHARTKLSYRYVASAIGIDPAHWWRICHGERCPSRSVAFKIIDTFGLAGQESAG